MLLDVTGRAEVPMQYPAMLAPAEGGGVVASFRDIPEAITQGDNEADALAMAKDALMTALNFYYEDKRPIPMPSAAEAGEYLVAWPPTLA